MGSILPESTATAVRDDEDASDFRSIQVRRLASVIEDFRRDPMLQTLTPGTAVAWLSRLDSNADVSDVPQESMRAATEVFFGLSAFRPMLYRLGYITVASGLVSLFVIYFAFGMVAAAGASAGFLIVMWTAWLALGKLQLRPLRQTTRLSHRVLHHLLIRVLIDPRWKMSSDRLPVS